MRLPELEFRRVDLGTDWAPYDWAQFPALKFSEATVRKFVTLFNGGVICTANGAGEGRLRRGALPR